MKKIESLLYRRQTTVGSAAFILMSMVFASRVLGLFRDRLLSARFAPEELGVYFAAFRIPNFLFEILVLGAITAAFIPVFTTYVTTGKEDEAHKIASTLINVSSIIFFLIAVPLFLWTRELSALFAPGFSDSQVNEMTSYTRIMILFQVMPLLIGNFFTGILQSYNSFIIPALAPVIYNVGIIIGIFAFTSTFGLYAPVIGVGIGAILFLLVQIPPLLRLGYRHTFILDVKHKGVGEVGRLMVPRTIGLAVSQIDTTVDLVLASLLGARMVTIFNFAQHLQQLPIGLFGVTIAQAALPTLSGATARDDMELFKKTIVRSLHQILFFILPASVLFIVLRIPLVRLVFGASRFDWQATVLTGMTLSTFSISLFSQSLTHVLARGFYALHDSKTPVIFGIVAIFINTILSILFIVYYKFPIWSLGLSTSLASIVQTVLLFIFLDRKIQHFSRFELFLPALKMVIASMATGIMLYIPLKLFDQLIFDTTRTFGLILLTGTAGSIGLGTYFFLSWVLGVGELQSVFKLLRKVRSPLAFMREPVQEIINGGIQDKVT